MMNKQEAIEKIEKEKSNLNAWEDLTRNHALDDALAIVRKIEEHEKPMLNKEEAEWVDNLTDLFDIPDALYYITRCGYGDGFIFDFWGDTYELPLEEGIGYGELCVIKERLVDAVIYGYGVKKEKLYTVEIPNPYDDDQRDFGLYKNRNGEVILDVFITNDWRELDEVKLTEREIKKNFAYLWEAGLANEVEE